jgi:hypothetical protein
VKDLHLQPKSLNQLVLHQLDQLKMSWLVILFGTINKVFFNNRFFLLKAQKLDESKEEQQTAVIKSFVFPL